MLMALNLLELDGEDHRKRPLRERRQALEHLLQVKQPKYREVERGFYKP
jgi:ATP-dependent DNA ligase